MGDLTVLIQQARNEPTAARRVFETVYDELHRIAKHRMATERSGHTLQATALVHEVYLRLVGVQSIDWADRAHFFRAAADAMRQILVDHARSRSAAKRGGERRREPLLFDAVEMATAEDPGEILMLDECISRLETEDPETSAVVRLRFFAGLSMDDTAAALGVSPSTVDRQWAFARAWLRREMSRGLA
jgi:RNA polymerase sigma factor (TIGR02999 family)